MAIDPATHEIVGLELTVQACWAIGRDAWKKGTPYHQRSLAETAMLRFKKILGCKVS